MEDPNTIDSLQGRIHFRNGKVWDPGKKKFNEGEILIDDGIFEEIAFKGRIPSSSIRGAERIDLQGGHLSPSFVDAHMHLFQWSISSQGSGLSKATSYREVLDRMNDVATGKVENNFFESSGILFGTDLDETRFPDADLDLVNELEREFSDIPVIIRRVCGHKAFANDKGLSVLGINDSGSHDGIILDDPAMDIPWRFSLDHLTRTEFLSKAIDMMYSLGVTGGVEILPSSMVKTFDEVMRDTGREMDLTLSIINNDDIRSEDLRIPVNWKEAGEPSFRNDLYPVIFEKFFLDGSIGSRTASFSFDYTDSGRKEPLVTEEDLQDQLEISEQNGLVPMVHCIGDEAIRTAIKVLEKNPSIYRLEHAEMIDGFLIDLMTSGRGSLCLQPNFPIQWEGRNGLYERSLGHHYSSLNPFRSIANSGIDWCFGTDLMPPGPLFAMKGAVFHPIVEHRIQRNIAYNGFLERSRRLSFLGNIEEKCFKEGSKADMIYVNDHFSKVIMTFLKGKCTHYNMKSDEP